MSGAGPRPDPAQNIRPDRVQSEKICRVIQRTLYNRCQFHQHFMSRFFVLKLFVQLFCTCILGFNLFWRKEIGRKAALKMLMKLTTGVL
jgi:hypothetical protein